MNQPLDAQAAKVHQTAFGTGSRFILNFGQKYRHKYSVHMMCCLMHCTFTEQVSKS